MREFILSLEPSFCNGLCVVHPVKHDDSWPKCLNCKIRDQQAALRSSKGEKGAKPDCAHEYAPNYCHKFGSAKP